MEISSQSASCVEEYLIIYLAIVNKTDILADDASK